MSLIMIVIVLIVVGVLLWLVNTYIPMAGPIKAILNIIVVICVIFWLLQVFGVISGATTKERVNSITKVFTTPVNNG